MKVHCYTVNLAFEDMFERSTEHVLDLLYRAAFDGLEAESACIRLEQTKSVAIADIDFDAENAENHIEEWHNRAQQEFE